MGFFANLFNEDKKILKTIENKIDKVMALENTMANLSDDELKHKTVEFKQRLKNGETLDDIAIEAFATVREAAKRVIGEFPYRVQLIGAMVLHQGDIAEMKTGEGKTLTSVMTVYLNALSEHGVHVVTVNEYLAQRDSEWMGEIHRFLGLSVGLNLRELSPAQKRAAYACDITYTTNSELGFDYLRDNMVTRVEDRVLRELNYALVDEVDSILIDESRTPLIISGGQKQTANLYLQADRFVKSLKENEYDINIKDKSVFLTEDGTKVAERYFKLDNLYAIEHTNLVHHINQALKANYIMKLDIEYVVEDGEVIIVDQNTGRKMPGREYSDGLHQAIQAKEGLDVKIESTTLATITYQNFFRLYNKLAGMTGTAKTEQEEFLKIYNMRVLEIPTNRPIARIDNPDAVFATKKAKYNALMDEVKNLHDRGIPVLVGTISVETSELLSKYLSQRKIKHEVLNAKNHAREAEIIALAGRKGAVTIATNMAGRGTDIKIDDEVKSLGGLAVLGSERHESRRIDNQLRGRSGRQGDPGMSRFYVALDDELMLRFGNEKILEAFKKGVGDNAIESKILTKSISSAQKKIEGHNFDIRKTLLDYDDVLRQQRETMYEQRNFILDNDDIKPIIKNMYLAVISTMIDSNIDHSAKKPSLTRESLLSILKQLNISEDKVDDFIKFNIDDLKYQLSDYAYELYLEKIERVKEEIIPAEKAMVLRTYDRAWVNHIDIMSKLREGIHLRSYAQDNPLNAYISEGFNLYQDMMDTVARDIVNFCSHVKIVEQEVD